MRLCLWEGNALSIAVVGEAIVREVAKREGIASRIQKAVSDFNEEQNKRFNDCKNDLLIEICIKGVHEKIKSIDEDIQKYCDDNEDSFENPVAYMLRYLFVSDIQQTAQNAYERLRSGESFEKVVKEVSQDTDSATNVGLIGSLGGRCALVPEFGET